MINKVINEIKSKKDQFINNKLSKLFSGSTSLAGVYYSVFNKVFGREYRAVLAGKIHHLKEAEQTKANYFLLVRNTHRIEKGLLMRPRRAVFGKDYITETIDSFEGLYHASYDKNNMQYKWFYDVLSEYFNNAGENKIIEKQHERFKKIVDTYALNGSPVNRSIPYQRSFANRSTITYEEFFKLARQRRSVRWFLDKPVDREDVDKAILAANQSPSACNRQPFEFRIFDDPALVKELVTFPGGTTGYGHNIPMMIVIVGNLDAYFDERDRHIIYIDGSLAAMSFMLALETIGLSSCPINWPDVEKRERKMEQFLKLQKFQRPIMCMGVGYADPEGMVAFSEKRPLDQIRKYN